MVGIERVRLTGVRTAVRVQHPCLAVKGLGRMGCGGYGSDRHRAVASATYNALYDRRATTAPGRAIVLKIASNGPQGSPELGDCRGREGIVEPVDSEALDSLGEAFCRTQPGPPGIRAHRTVFNALALGGQLGL